MKYSICVALIISLLIPGLFRAQTITISEEIPLKNDIAYELIGKYSGRTLLFRDRDNSFEVYGFNDRMRQIWNKELEVDKRNPSLLDVVGGKEDFIVVYRFRESGRVILRADKYDPAANRIDSLRIGDVGPAFNAPRVDLSYSEDDRQLLVFYSDQPSEVQLILIDLIDMRILWEGLLLPEEMNFDRDFLQAVVSNSGRLFFILNKDNFPSRRKDHILEVWAIDESTVAPVALEINLGDRLTYDAYFSYDNLNDQMIGVGLWSETNSERANGYYFIRFNPDRPEEQALSFQPFPSTFLAAFHGKKVKQKKGINEVSLQDAVLRRDGGVILLGEQTRIYERFSGMPSRFAYDPVVRANTDFYFEDMFAISIHPDGRLHWANVLPKKQYSQNDNGIFSSFFLFKTPASLRLIFNDEIKWENTVSEYVLTGTGKADRNSLFSTKNLELKLRFRDAIQTAANELLVPSERRNRLRVVRLEF